MKPDMILWDWDNTLVDTRSVARKALFRLGHETDVAVTEADVTEVIGGHLVDFWYRHYGSDPLPSVRRFIAYYQEFGDEARLFPETIRVLKRVQEWHIPQIVVSNKNQEILEAEADRFGLTDYFQKIVGTINQGIGKPSKEFADKALGPDWPARLIMVGDGASDMAFAQTIGAFSVLIGPGAEPPYPCDRFVSSLVEVETCLSEMCRGKV